jgi:hypothetical protein
MPKTVDQIDAASLEKAVDELNESELLLDEDGDPREIETVGVEAEELFQNFLDAMAGLIADKKVAELEDKCATAVEVWNEAHKEEAEKEKEKKKAPAKKKAAGTGPMRMPTTFKDLKKFLDDPPTPTNYMDKLLLEGGTWQELVDKFKPYAEEKGYSGFKSVSVLKSHVKYRESKGWQFKRKGEGDDETIKLTGVEKKED